MTVPKSLFLAAQLVLLGLAAFFAARATSAGLAAAWRPGVQSATLDPPEMAVPDTRKPRSFYRPITERDIFNPPRKEEAPETVQVVSTLKAKLLGTAPGTAIDSYAIIEDQTTRKQDLYRRGDRFQDRTVHQIERDHVVLRRGNTEEILRLEDLSDGPAAAPAAQAAEDTGASGIRALSDTEYEIEQAEIDKALENMNQLFTQVRAVPHFQDGKANGFRLFAIRRNSVFDQIGLRNGDIIQEINGDALTDPAKAMGLMQDLRDEGRVEVVVTRNREPVTLTYEIR